MASPQYTSSSEPAKIEQIITEFFAKSLHIILEARSPCVPSHSYHSGDFSILSTPSSSSTSSIHPRDKWFNLALRECPEAVENLDWWRQSNLEFLVVDVILVRRQTNPVVAHPHPHPGACLLRNLSGKENYPNSWSSKQDELVSESSSEKIVERWIVQYERQKCTSRDSDTGSSKKSSGRSSHSPVMSAVYKKTYKRSIVLMRSLYATVRLLPCYKVFKDLSSTVQIHPFILTHKISSFVEPFTRMEDSEMKQFCFTPVDTPCGRLCLSVSYLPLPEDVLSDPSTPLTPQFITDYVGSPLADPLKRIQSLPSSGLSPGYVSFARRHSFSNDRGSNATSSPSPTYLRPNTLPPYMHLISQNISQPQKNINVFDECYPSPPFSPSTSLSPSSPCQLTCGNSSRLLLRTESSPIRIPITGSSSSQLYDCLKPTTPKSTRHRGSNQLECAMGPVSDFSSPEIMSRKKLEIGSSLKGLHKVYSLNNKSKEDVGPFRDVKILARHSPRAPFPNSSRLSSLDDYDDSEFTWPFAIEYDDIRVESSGEKGHVNQTLVETTKSPYVQRSQDAAIGSLVQMLRKAPPLHKDFTSEVSIRANWMDGIKSDTLEPTTSSISTSGLVKSRTTVDALEELRSYKEMKDLLLRKATIRERKSTN